MTPRTPLARSLIEARARTDTLFGLVKPDAFFERPIPERHRIIFYLGHLDAFDWNQIGQWALGMKPLHASFEQMVAKVSACISRCSTGTWRLWSAARSSTSSKV